MAASENSDKSIGFKSLELDGRLVERLQVLGYEEPTPIQRQAIPPLLDGRDILGQAATGTGKTAAFALPMIQRLLANKRTTAKHPAGIVLVPTRELAMQVAQAVHDYSQGLGIRVLPIYGGQSYDLQVRAFRRGVDIVVATPGRALDHIRNKTLHLSAVEFLVLDEADEMLDMGFLEDIETILAATPPTRQTALISATLPARVATVAKHHLKTPMRIEVAAPRLEAGRVPAVKQSVYIMPRGRKVEALGRLLEVETIGAAIIFCRTRNEVDDLASRLDTLGYSVEPLHGGMSQAQRDRVMKKLRGKEAELVIATDVAARGLDIDRLTHVINFDVPSAPEDYIHRVGRIGRAGREGVAITLAEPREHRQLRNIERTMGQKITVATLPSLTDLQARRLELTRVGIKDTITAGDFDRYRDILETLAEEHDLVDIALAAIKLVHIAASPPQESAEAAPSRSVAPMTRIYISLGRTSGVRPQDLVGAITGEAHIDGSDIGAIQIANNFSLVEIRDDLVDKVVSALESSSIKGQAVKARRDQKKAPTRGPAKGRR